MFSIYYHKIEKKNENLNWHNAKWGKILLNWIVKIILKNIQLIGMLLIPAYFSSIYIYIIGNIGCYYFQQ